MLENKRSIIIIGAVLGIGVLILVGMLIWVRSRGPKIVTYTTDTGQQIAIKDFTKTSVSAQGATLTLVQNPSFGKIIYNSDSKLFSILVRADDRKSFDQRLPLAEQEFLDQLGISQYDACKLNVEVSSDNANVEGLYRLNFCSVDEVE